jgi:hypothetical protein
LITREFDITVRIPEQGYIPFCFQVVQNDKDVYGLNIRITDGVNEIDYSQIADATITFALANNAVVQSDPERLTISAEGISYEMGTSEISCPGKVLASIQLIGENGERLTTARFQFEVIADLIKPSVVISSNEFPILQKLVADVEQLKQDIVNLQIPDNSILDVKLSDAAGQIKSQVNAHKAETTSELISYNRALPGVNETVIIMLSENRTPKRIDVRVAASDVETRKTMSIGSWEQNRQDCIACVGDTGGFVRQNNYVSSLIDTWGGATSMITIQNVRQGAFDIAITAISGGSAGSYNFQFVVHYHD